jgi:hypothetical protein
MPRSKSIKNRSRSKSKTRGTKKMNKLPLYKHKRKPKSMAETKNNIAMITIKDNGGNKEKPVLLVSAGFSVDAMRHTHEIFSQYRDKYRILEVQYHDNVKEMQTKAAANPNTKYEEEYKLYHILSQQLGAILEKTHLIDVNHPLYVVAKSAGTGVVLMLPESIPITLMAIQCPAPMRDAAKLPKRNISAYLGWYRDDPKIPYNNSEKAVKLLQKHYANVQERCYDGATHDFAPEFVQEMLEY